MSDNSNNFSFGGSPPRALPAEVSQPDGSDYASQPEGSDDVHSAQDPLAAYSIIEEETVSYHSSPPQDGGVASEQQSDQPVPKIKKQNVGSSGSASSNANENGKDSRSAMAGGGLGNVPAPLPKHSMNPDARSRDVNEAVPREPPSGNQRNFPEVFPGVGRPGGGNDVGPLGNSGQNASGVVTGEGLPRVGAASDSSGGKDAVADGLGADRRKGTFPSAMSVTVSLAAAPGGPSKGHVPEGAADSSGPPQPRQPWFKHQAQGGETNEKQLN